MSLRSALDFFIDPTNYPIRRLKIIAKRHDIIEQNIPDFTSTISDITDIPEHITAFINTTENNHNKQVSIQENDHQDINNDTKPMSCPMEIDILNDVVLNGLPLDQSFAQNISSDPLQLLNNLSFKAIIDEYTLDFKQSISFEIMASSFILRSLYTENITSDVLQAFFKQMMNN